MITYTNLDDFLFCGPFPLRLTIKGLNRALKQQDKQNEMTTNAYMRLNLTYGLDNIQEGRHLQDGIVRGSIPAATMPPPPGTNRGFFS